MRSKFAQYLNEIVSLTVMGLMCLALVAGQAGASQATVQGQAEAAGETVVLDPVDRAEPPSFLEDRLRLVDGPELAIDITFRIRHTGE
jgi:hypothetical protein